MEDRMRASTISKALIGLLLMATAGALSLAAGACGEACHEGDCDEDHTTEGTSTTAAGPGSGGGGGQGGGGGAGGA
jgi:hypothetical protein